MVQKLFNDAMSALKKGDLKGARHIFIKLLELKADHVFALHYYGVCSIALGLYDDVVVERMNASLASGYKNSTICKNHLNTAFLAYRNRKYSIALNLLSYGSKVVPNGYDLTAGFAKILMLLNKPQAALDVLSEINDNSHFECNYYRSASAKLVGDETQASHYFLRALRIKPMHNIGPIGGRGMAAEFKLLICYATENLPFHPVISDDEIAFAIDGGHFDTNILLQNGRYEVSRLFVSDSPECMKAFDKLDQFDVVINAMADAESTADSLALLHEQLNEQHISSINSPCNVLETTREGVYKKLCGIENLMLAETLRVKLAASISNAEKQFEAIEFPFLLRPLGSSTGIGLVKIDHREELLKILPSMLGQEYNVCPFKDFVSDDGFYRKYRVFVINGEIFPEHCVVSDHWNVHSSSRLNIMKNHECFRDEEKRYVNNFQNVLTADHCEVILKIYEALSLDYFGVDFTISKNGEFFVFEANSSMRVNPDYIDDFPYLSTAIDNIVTAFQQMLEQKK